MNVDRFITRVEVLNNARDKFEREVAAAFWDNYDKANREHKAKFVRTLTAGIIGKTGWDQKVIAVKIGVTPPALSTWKENGNATQDNLQRLLDLSDEVLAARPDFEPAIERYNAAIMGAMQCLLEKVGETADCLRSDDMFEWIVQTPFDCWSRVALDDNLLNSMFQNWLSEFPETSGTCSSSDLFYTWVPAYIVCGYEFNQKGV